MGSNNSSCKFEKEYLTQYNAIYQVMYDQKHIKDFLLYLRQKLSEKGHFVKISGEKLFACFQDDLETICLKLSLSNIDQATAIGIYDYLQYIVYSQMKLLTLKDSYDNYIYLLKDKINPEKTTHHNKEYKVLLERFLNKYEELKEMINIIERLDTNTIKSCLKTCTQKYVIPNTQNLTHQFQRRSSKEQFEYYDERESTISSMHFQQEEEEQFEAY